LTSASSKTIPFVVLAIVAALFAIDIYTPFEITETHVALVTAVLTPMGLGGLVAKGWDTFKAIKSKQ